MVQYMKKCEQNCRDEDLPPHKEREFLADWSTSCKLFVSVGIMWFIIMLILTGFAL